MLYILFTYIYVYESFSTTLGIGLRKNIEKEKKRWRNWKI